MLSILFIVFILIVIDQIGLFSILLSRFSFVVQKQTNEQVTNPVSVIVACHNEEKNISKLLENLVLQDYEHYEIVLVDDASTDNTFSILKKYANQHENIKVVVISPANSYSGNKKNALTKAIAAASFEYLLFTDADCIPKTKYWISKMAQQFDDDKQIVLGYGAYQKQKGWLNKLIRYETLLTAWQYFSFARFNMPYMGVGRNLGYTKSIFNQAKGFSQHKHIRSGDDDLLVNQMGTSQNIALCWQEESHTLSIPKSTFFQWIDQKRRHITTASSYNWMHQLLLGAIYLSNFLFFSLSAALLIYGYKLQWIISLIAVRYFFYYLTFIPVAKKLDEKDLYLLAPFLEIFLILFQFCIFMVNLVKKPTRW